MGFFTGTNPARAARPYLEQIPGMAREQLNPYIQQGQTAGTAAQGTYAQMAQNPMEFLNNIFSGYTPSKGFQHQYEQATKGLRNAAAAGGFAGTGAHQADQAELVNRILGQGQGQYFDQIMQILGGGLTGQEQAAQRGFNANTDLTSILGTNLGNQANLEFEGQQQKNATKQNLINQAVRLAMAGMTGGVSELGQMFGKGGQQGMTSSWGATPAAMGMGAGVGSQGSNYINDYLSNQRQFGGRNF